NRRGERLAIAATAVDRPMKPEDPRSKVLGNKRFEFAHDPIEPKKIGLSPVAASKLRRKLFLAWFSLSLAVAGVCYINYIREVRQTERGVREREVTRVAFFGRLF